VSTAAKMLELLLVDPARFFAQLLPVASAVLLAMIANLPISFSGGILPSPLLALAAVYYWSLVRPDLVPAPAVLAVGLFEDVFSGGAPGVWAAGFLAAYAFTDRQRETLGGLWGLGAIIGFAGAVSVAAATAFLVVALIYLRWPPLAPLLLAGAATAVYYPFVVIPLGWLARRVVGPQRKH
jgi:rod shape-determining protein MreD